MSKRRATATVSKILNFSCVDGSGNRLVIFLQGCNYQCKNCHNPHTIGICNHCGDCVKPCPSHALSLSEGKIHWDAALCTHCDRCLEVCPNQSNPKTQLMGVEDILQLVRKHQVFLSGITVSGGEATLQLPFIVELFSAIKADPTLRHLTCMVDTNGSLSLTGWEKVLPVLDGAMVDLKAWQEETHTWLTSRSHHRVIETINMLAKHDKLEEVRLLHIPGITDFELEIDALAHFLGSLPQRTSVRLNAFQHHGVVGEALQWQTCSQKQIESLANALGQRGIDTLYRKPIG
ncbi:YjjW family glycine radical enzyme activase [Photobacterium rosenbergii]|uniref:YjjW family glycine radical enzyme activase n=1 Tax=Photobacterium rosenbergii TaxID=294936 RepID=UPI001C990406|nr:YjjW family glycine radical enzyme activase [Photobacterium rosenbergii]MBY5945963.1 YjjW family glycine radical enzyme activase [Photobacterium rosenbergii]